MSTQATKQPRTEAMKPTHEVIAKGCLLTFLAPQDSFTLHLNNGTKLCLKDGCIWAGLSKTETPDKIEWLEAIETPNWIPVMLEHKRIKELA